MYKSPLYYVAGTGPSPHLLPLPVHSSRCQAATARRLVSSKLITLGTQGNVAVIPVADDLQTPS